MKYYIGQRNNPQLPKPYYILCGKLTDEEVNAMSDPTYGSIELTSYITEQEYNDKINQLRLEGYYINQPNS
jgi:hypothetical protein